MKTLALTALAVLMLAMPGVADESAPLVDVQGSEDSSIDRSVYFRLDEASALELTVGVQALRQRHRPLLRVQFYSVDEDGNETEIHRYRIQFENNTPRTSGRMRLDAGRYRLRYIVGQADYVVKLEHD